MTRDMRLGRNEYLGKEENRCFQGRGAPRSSSVTRSSGSCTVDRGGFSFGGHRLSSLYRTKRKPPIPFIVLKILKHFARFLHPDLSIFRTVKRRGGHA